VAAGADELAGADAADADAAGADDPAGAALGGEAELEPAGALGPHPLSKNPNATSTPSTPLFRRDAPICHMAPTPFPSEPDREPSRTRLAHAIRTGGSRETVRQGR